VKHDNQNDLYKYNWSCLALITGFPWIDLKCRLLIKMIIYC